MEDVVDRGRGMTKSDDAIWLEKGHSRSDPRLLRLNCPDAHHPEFWTYARKSILPDIAVDLVGPDVRYSHSLINFKWAEVGQEVKWHQDIPFYPHTNYGVLAIGIYLDDVDDEMGPMGVIPGSHKGEIYNHYNDKDQWTGDITDRDLETVALDTAEYLMGPAGSVTVHNCCTIHGSKPNLSDRGRPLLLNVYSAADAFTAAFSSASLSLGASGTAVAPLQKS